jgi:DNA-binding response OmpR family regulator
VAELTRGDARRRAEQVEAPQHQAAEAADWNRKARSDNKLSAMMSAFALTKTEARYLGALADGRVHSKEALLAECHDETEHLDINSVNVYVHKLRRKLQTRLVDIGTVRGLGYQMAPADVARTIKAIDAESAGPGRDEDEADLARLAGDDEAAA